LSTVAGGSISFTASNIDIRGDITAAGGSLSFTSLNVSPYDTAVLANQPVPQIPAAQPGRGIFTLAEGATLNTAGLVTDDRFLSSAATPAIPDGGSIVVDARTADLATGSVIDVSGG